MGERTRHGLCGYCYELPDGRVGRCICDECVQCCECGRVLIANREDEPEERPEIWAPEGSGLIDGCGGKVCGWWPCECPPEEVDEAP